MINTERILVNFVRGNQYLEQIKWLHFGWNWNGNNGAGFERIFESMLFSFAAMSHRCWHLVNQFTNWCNRKHNFTLI